MHHMCVPCDINEESQQLHNNSLNQVIVMLSNLKIHYQKYILRTDGTVFMDPLEQRFPNIFFRDPVIFMLLLCDPLKFVSPIRAYL